MNVERTIVLFASVVLTGLGLDRPARKMSLNNRLGRLAVVEAVLLIFKEWGRGATDLDAFADAVTPPAEPAPPASVANSGRASPVPARRRSSARRAFTFYRAGRRNGVFGPADSAPRTVVAPVTGGDRRLARRGTDRSRSS